MDAAAAHYRVARDGIDIFVRLTPKAARDAIEGVESTADGRAHLKARVRAVPEKGKANQALVRLLAETLGVPAAAVSVVAGDTARLKTLRISGDAHALAQAAARLAT